MHILPRDSTALLRTRDLWPRVSATFSRIGAFALFLSEGFEEFVTLRVRLGIWVAHEQRVLECGELAVWQILQEVTNFALSVAAMATQGPNRGEFARFSPARHSLWINAEERGDLGWGQ